MSAEQAGAANRGRVVIFDDEVSMGRILVKTLGMEGFEAKAFTNPVEGLNALGRLQPDVLLTDMRMPGLDGMAVLDRVRKEYPDVPVLLLTAYGTVEGAVAAMQAGAYNYITKPFEQSNLLAQINRAIDHRRMAQENARLSERISHRDQGRQILGESRAIRHVREMITRAAPTDSSVLLTGPSGVGKELAASAIHNQSGRADGRFVAINCPSIPQTLIESEMFGYERGAFTGADRSKMGLVELAQGGTLFLDEVAELPIEMQVKLLRVIQEREIQRVGGLRQIPVDLRLIAATNRDLVQELKEGRFREDLYFRLNVIQIELPPLKERPEDIPLLVGHFVEHLGRRIMKRPGMRLTDEAMEALVAYDWPGNVRELENVIERAYVLSVGPEIVPDDLTLDLRRVRSAAGGETHPTEDVEQKRAWPIEYRQARDRFEREYLLQILEKAAGNMTQAAQISGISRRNLYDKLQKVGLHESEARKK